MARSLSLGIGVLGTALAAGLFFAGTRQASQAPEKSGPPPVLDTVAGELGATLREAGAGIDARANTLAELPRLRAAVATDAATVRDLTTDELAFRAKTGETIEIAQVLKDGHVEQLFRTEGGAAPSPPLDKPGHHLAIEGQSLYLSVVVDVPPKERGDELRGAIAISRVIDVGALGAKLDAAKVAGALVVGDGRIGLGATALTNGSETDTASVPGDLGAKILVRSMAAPAKQDDGRRNLMGALAAVLALVSWVIAALLGRGNKGAAIAGSARDSTENRIGAGGANATATNVNAPAAGGVTNPATGSALAAGQGSTAASGGALAAGAALASTDVNVAALADAAVARLGAQPARSGPRTQIGRYSLLRMLGSGGMADVYLARATGEAGFEKLVALKVLQSHMARHPFVVEHFLDEARLASRLGHPNVVQISDLGKADDEYFIAMEYVDGRDLEHLLATCRERGIPVPMKVAFTIVRRICDGLHAAHIATGTDGKPLDLVHRDVKSANVFVSKNGEVKVGDFGIAKANQATRTQTEVGTVKGTVAYMAPEHRLGETVDRRADLFALGGIAYEIFAGTEVNLDLIRLLAIGREGWPHLTPPSQVRPGVPPEVDAIIFKALAYEREERYPSCEAMEEALAEVADKHGFSNSEKAVAQWAVSVIDGTPGASSTGNKGSGTTP